MPRPDRTLSATEARAYYDRFGAKQDSQGFYEDPAVDDLIAHAGFETAQQLFEFGCGTGKLAARLLSGPLPGAATYLGCDVSPTMVELAARRLAPHHKRASATQSDGAVRFPLADHSVDRVLSAYVLDLLSEQQTELFFAEAHRVLAAQGRLCLVSLTEGVNLRSRLVAGLWARIFRWRPAWVGGCRPIRLERHVDATRWRVEYRNVVTAFGVPSEVLVLTALPRPHDIDG
ncbi:MAG: class I SAM-dependent methyltransferase [Acidobacteriota bacterium]